MNPENNHPEKGFSQAERFAELKLRMENTHKSIEEQVRATEVKLATSEERYETPAILLSKARTKAHRDFEHIEDVLERGSAINRRKAEINNYHIIPDEAPIRNLSREDGKEEIRTSDFKKKFLE